MWHIIASRHNQNKEPLMWNGHYFGDMQKQMNQFYEIGYKHFEVWEVENHG
jgi:hypothetical protein